jgi:hypothetical protein
VDDKNWPAWFYGPNGASAVFQSQTEVPEGWVSHPSLVGQPTGATVESVAIDAADVEIPIAKVVDASGVPWDATINTANRAQTVAGLWQLLPGKSRPAPVKFDL